MLGMMEYLEGAGDYRLHYGIGWVETCLKKCGCSCCHRPEDFVGHLNDHH